MKSTAASQRIYYLFGCLLLISVIGLSTISRQSSLSTTYKSLFSSATTNDDLSSITVCDYDITTPFS